MEPSQGQLLVLHQDLRQILSVYSAVIICMKRVFLTRNNPYPRTALHQTICSTSNVLVHVEGSLHQKTGPILSIPPSLLFPLLVVRFSNARTSCMGVVIVCTLCVTLASSRRQLSLKQTTRALEEGARGGHWAPNLLCFIICIL